MCITLCVVGKVVSLYQINDCMEFPLAFVENMRNLLSDECDAFLSALMSDASVSVRVNDKLSLFGDKKPVPWCPDGYYLPERPSFTKDPLFHAGAYYVQEASSMFLYQALKQCVPHDAVVLDLCAAPGGKSTLASQYLSRGLLVANEIVRSRAYILSENIQKWGNDNVVVCNNRPADFASSGVIFDAILVDAPCSGEGMFRKDEGAIAEWSPANVHMCAERQREILTAIWPALKEGGILVYSTCTFNQEEDEENVFRYYYSTDLSNADDFQYYVNQVMASSLYDLGITAEYGDRLLTLSTCSYHTENGRFVVVAREKNTKLEM